MTKNVKLKDVVQPRPNPNLKLSKMLDYLTDLGWEYTCCLLYTSPSPRDSCASRMPSSA